MPLKPLRLTLAISLIVLLLGWMTGCLYEDGHTDDSRDHVTKNIGSRFSSKPLKIGSATREEVLKLLGGGEPGDSPNQLVYHWYVYHRNGRWIGLCFSMGRAEMYTGTVTKYSAVLEFNEKDVLTHFHIKKEYVGEL